MSKIKKFRTKIPDLGTFLYGIHRFWTSLILQAYERLKNRLPRMQEQGIQVTDDASVVELFTETRVKLVEASYQNIKITTPEDMKTAEAFLED